MKNHDTSKKSHKTASGLSLLVLGTVNLIYPCLFALIAAGAIALAANAQFAKPLLPSSGHSLSQGQAATVSESRQSIGEAGTWINPIFLRTTVYVYTNVHKKGMPSGRHLAITIRPSTLTEEQVADISGILGINMLSGQTTIRAEASEHQLELIQSVLAPSANDSTLGLAALKEGKKSIDSDPTPAQWALLRRSGDDTRFIYAGPLPSAKVLARWFVIIGLVAATIYVAFASFSIITGQSHGGNRVIAAAAGVMLLLMGYTIFKIMVMNSIDANSIDNQNSISKQLPEHGLAKEKQRTADTPRLPLGQSSAPGRSGLPVQPLLGRNP